MSSTKIEARCMAIIINSNCGNSGNVVTVAYFVGPLSFPFKPHPRWWALDTELTFADGTKHKLAPEYMLMRIDGYSEQEIKELVCEKSV